jgi:hypothetical protein
MIGWSDVYKVVAATVPLYFALFLGYGSVRWWRIFTRDQCDAVNRLVAFFALPFFTFEFTLHTDPFQVNYRAVAADVISKALIVAVIAVWARFLSKGGSITSFSLSTLTNSLVVGVPMALAMYGEWAQQLVVQLSVFQAIVWLTLLLFVLEVRKAAIGMADSSPAAGQGRRGQRRRHGAGCQQQAVALGARHDGGAQAVAQPKHLRQLRRHHLGLRGKQVCSKPSVPYHHVHAKHW